MTTLSPRARSSRIAGISEGSFMPIRSWPKNRCFVDSKIDSAAAFAPLLYVSFEKLSVMRVASSAARRLA